MTSDHPSHSSMENDIEPCDEQVSIIPLRRLIWVVALLLMGFGAVSFVYWKRNNADIPPLESLKLIRANELNTDMAHSLGKSSIEFSDTKGNRYQVSQLGGDEWGRIQAALNESKPVILRYGRWDSPFPSNNIFTVYQLEIGDSTVLPYSRITGSMMLVKKYSLILTLAPIVLIVGLAALFCSRFVKIIKHTTIHKIL